MNPKTILLTLVIAVCCIFAVQPIAAQNNEDPTVIYQTSFASDPLWTTNSPSSNYWDPNTGMYRFSIEPSSGGYAYIPVVVDSGSFSLDYDFMLTRIDQGATFRMGLSGSEMDPSRGTNVISMFTNEKYGQIMWLHLVTQGNKLVEVNSQHDAVEMGPDAYKGPTTTYEVNKTYHITINYIDNTKTLSMKVREVQSGKELWSYFIQSAESITGLNRIYLGSKGDYGQQNIFAKGYIDNVRLTIPSATPVVSETPVSSIPVTTVPVTVTPSVKPTLKTTVPTPYPTTTPQSPLPGILPVIALGICGAFYCAMKKN